jgi:alanine racemase
VKAPEIRLDIQALKANFEFLSRARAGVLPLMPVVKADAYGHGAVAIATALEKHFDENRMPFFCVARWAEAAELRRAGVSRPVLVLSQFDCEEIAASPLEKLSLLVASPQDLVALARLDASVRRRLSGVHVHFNTGMNRLGFAHDLAVAELGAVLARLYELGLKVEGFSTHLARSEEDPAVFTDTQAARFRAAVANAKSAWRAEWGVFPRWIHAANSAGLLRDLGAELSAARPGLFLWGVHQDLETRARLLTEFPELALKPVLSARASLREVFWVKKGEGVSYGHRWTAPEPRRVAIVNFGYADGLPRSLSRAASDASPLPFWVRGAAAPILGTVTMDMVLVDLTDHPEGAAIEKSVREKGETVWATWIGSEQPVEKHASVLKTISYEVLCDLSRRVKRVVDDA